MASSSARPTGPPPADPPRPDELQDALNRFVYHPLAGVLARALHPSFVSPNAVSIAGMLLVWAAAFAYTELAWPVSVLVGFTLHLSWHVVDGADGHLARLRGTASATGELVDGVCDYAGHTLLYIVLAIALDDRLGGWAWALGALAGASHIAQTNHAETQRRAYLWWVYGTPWLKHAKAEGDEIFAHGNWFSLGFSWMARLYLKLPNKMTPWAARIDAIVADAAGDPAPLARIARLARERSSGTLAYQKLLGPNPRTLILGASMAAGSPLWFFLTEAVLLNLLLVLSVRHHNRVARDMAAELG